MRAPVPQWRSGWVLPFRRLRDLPVEPGEVLFPLGIVRREFCQTRHDRVALPQEVERLCAVAGLPVHQRELGKAHREIALPIRIACVPRRKTLSDAKARAIGFFGVGKIALTD
jgi:hypothetical protein